MLHICLGMRRLTYRLVGRNFSGDTAPSSPNDMADQEEDFSSLPLPDRFSHKNWKVRKEGYEAAVKEFNGAVSENDPIIRQFTNDSGIWKGVVADSNVAAQQEGLGALCAFLDIAGNQGCVR